MSKPTESKPGIGRGVLQPGLGAGKFQVGRFYPPCDLAAFVEHFWTVRWDLRGQPEHTQDTLPYPSVHVVVERGRSEIVGVVTGKFSRTLTGRGRVFAAKFLPGGFFPFLARPLFEITDRRVPLDDVFSVDVRALEDELFADDDEARMVSVLSNVLRRHGAEPDATAAKVGQITLEISEDRSLTTVAEVSARASMTPRTLQRVFRRTVGVGPKWVIRRFRLQEAAERLAAHEALDLAALAQSLGYADQSHFVRDFRDLVGVPPGAYARASNDATDSRRRRE